MNNRNNDWRTFLNDTNDGIARFMKEIHVNNKTNGLYSVDILTISEDDETKDIVSFADNYREDELLDVISDASAYIKEQERLKKEAENYICYRKVSGWTHDMPALIHSLTEFPLFFYDEEKGTVEVVDEFYGIDAYEQRSGVFCVKPEDYEPALRQIEDHDKNG